MKTDSVQYLYSDAELKALLGLLQLRLPHLLPEDTVPEPDVELLTSAELCQQEGRTITVDRITTFLLKTMEKAERYCAAADPKMYLGLFVGQYAAVVMERKPPYWIVSPYETESEALFLFETRLEEVQTIEKLYIGGAGRTERIEQRGAWKQCFRQIEQTGKTE